MTFETVSIGDVADVTKLAGFEFTKYIEYNETGEIIALRALNLRNGTLDLTDIKRIDRSVSEKLPRSKLYINDILLTYTGNGYGDCAIVEEDDKYHLAPNICKIAPNPEKINPYFLYSVIRSSYFYQQMKNYIGGSSQPTIPMKTIRVLQVPYPPIQTQNQIASILHGINSKVVVNTAINENLEQQAQAIFEDMFPNVIYGEHSIGEYITPKRGKGLLSKNAIFGDVPVVAGGLEPATYHNTANTTAPVLTISASGANSGYVNLWTIPVWSSDSSFIDSSMTNNVYFWYVMLKIRQQEIYDSQTGSAQPHIYPKHISVLPITKLNEKDISNFTQMVTPMFDKIGKNKYENKRLAELRDTLLPKLMNGEIDVSEVKI